MALQSCVDVDCSAVHHTV